MKKLFTYLLTLLFVSAAVFFALRYSGADPILSMVSPDTLAANAHNVEALRERLGLNDPLVIQYLRWLGNAARGDFGYSLTGVAVSDVLFPRIFYTFQLSAVSLVLSAVFGIALGAASAYKADSLFDRIVSAASSVLLSLPQFFCAIILVYLFAIRIPVLPVGNRVSPGGGGFFDVLLHMILPVISLTLSLLSVVIRYTRACVAESLDCDFVRSARSRGIPEWRVLFLHALPASSRPIVTLLVLRLPMLVSGAVVIESVFSYPGIGLAMTNAVSAGDYPVVMAASLIIALAMILSSAACDVIAALIDPRVRSEVRV